MNAQLRPDRRTRSRSRVDELAEQFERILWHMDEPIAGAGVFPQLLVCDLAAEHGVKVVLGGQGGDELFGGLPAPPRAALQARRFAPARRWPAARRDRARRLARGEWRARAPTATRVTDEQLAPAFLERRRPERARGGAAFALSFATASELMLLGPAQLPARAAARRGPHEHGGVDRVAHAAARLPPRRAGRCASRRSCASRRASPSRCCAAPCAPWLPPSVAERRDKKGFPTPLGRWERHPHSASW